MWRKTTRACNDWQYRSLGESDSRGQAGLGFGQDRDSRLQVGQGSTLELFRSNGWGNGDGCGNDGRMKRGNKARLHVWIQRVGLHNTTIVF